MTNRIELAKQFGESLDNDDFQQTLTLLHHDCVYRIGQQTLTGPQAIVDSYEQNMIAGRQKLDQLVWGASRVEPLSDKQFYVHFTDYLTHAGEKYTHLCKQKLTFDEQNLIVQIQHIDDPQETARLHAFYNRVGIHPPPRNPA